MKYLNSIFGKTILAILLGFVALSAFYQINTYTINSIYQSVEDLSQPLQKIRIVNSINAEINNSNKRFKDLIARGNQQSLKQFQQKTKILLLLTDSLKMISGNNLNQQLLIDSIANLFRERNEKLINFYKYKQLINKADPYEEEIENLTELLMIDSSKPEMIINKETENIKSARIDTINVEPKKKNLLTKLFPPKKKIETVIIEEEATYFVSDTVFRPKENTGYIKAQELLKNISKTQQDNNFLLQKRENEINKFETTFTEKVTYLISTIESDLNEQTSNTQQAASESLSRSIRQINIIFLALLITTIILLSLILIDITKSKKYKLLLEQAKDEAENQSKAKEVFLSNMSHELRTPLQSIIGYSEQLLKNENKTENSNYTQAIKQSSEHLLNVVNEVLEFSSINSGKFTFEKTNFDLKKVIEDVINIVSLPTKQKGLIFEISGLPKKPIFINGDAFRLKQILLNLLGNAIKYTQTGTVTLQVTIREMNDKILPEFNILDTGPGIPYPFQHKIFEHFEQVSSNMEQRRSGTGLGLAITKALISGQGGNIKLKSTPGKGSQFTFVIPYNPADIETPHNPIKEDALHSPFEGEVWLVDDDNMILQLCSIILTKYNINHTCFTTANDMLNATKENIPTAAIMDIRMPGKSGIELCKELRLKYGNKVQTIAITAHALQSEKEEMLACGFNEILTKPFKEVELISLLKNLQPIVSEKEMNKHTDLSSIKKFSDSLDEEERKLIFDQFFKDSKKDINQIQEYLMHKNTNEIAAIAHRLAGRSAQVGAKEIGRKFREIELSIRDNEKKFLEKELISAISETNEILDSINLNI